MSHRQYRCLYPSRTLSTPDSHFSSPCFTLIWQAQSNESFAATTEPVTEVYDADPSNYTIPVGEGDTVDPGLDPWDDNSTLTEQISLHKLTENGNTTDYEQPFDSTTPLIDANYIEYLNYLEKFLNTSDPTNDFNYQYPDSYDYSFNLSTTFNTSTTPKKLSK